MKKLLIVIVLCGFVVPILAQAVTETGAEVGGWTLTDIRDVYADVGETMQTQALAPEGSHVAWITQDALCLYRLDTSERSCYDFPPDSTLDDQGTAFDRLAWSPDARTIAMTPNYYRYLHEPDMWLFDVASGVFSNITDDSVDEVFGDGSEGALIDIMPYWGDDNTLYFVRGGRNEASLTIQRYDMATAALETWFEFPAEFGTAPNVLPHPSFNPSGDAVVVGIGEPDPESPRNGIFIISAQGELEQVVSTAELLALFPEWLGETRGYVNGLTWAEAGIFAVLEAQSETALQVFRATFVIDPATGDARLLNDFAQFESVADYSTSPDEAAVPIVPNFAAVPSTGAVLFYVGSFINGGAQLIAQPVTDGDAVALVSFDEPIFAERYILGQSVHQVLQMLNAQNQVLIGGYLYTFDAPAQNMFGS
jgi:hypothetical protein